MNIGRNVVVAAKSGLVETRPTVLVATALLYCVLRFYAQSHSDNGYVHATVLSSAHALAQARPTTSYIPLVLLHTTLVSLKLNAS